METAFNAIIKYLPPRKLLLQKLIESLYPPLCLGCSTEISTDGFCGACWQETHFINGLVCDACGTPLLGDANTTAYCDTCLNEPPSWQRGRAAAIYNGGAAKSVMALKYADRWDLAKPLAKFMLATDPSVLETDLVAPVPLHWSRLLRRKYNQAALLSQTISDTLDKPHIPDLLVRRKRTTIQKSMDREQRFDNLKDAFDLNARFGRRVQGKSVLLIDDVMTTGATLSACAKALKAAGSGDVNVLVFARVAKPL